MDYSVREAKANFAQALSLAASGEKVVITKHGKPFAEIVPATVASATETIWERLDRARKELGINPDDFDLDDDWLARFNDPALSRRLLGIDD